MTIYHQPSSIQVCRRITSMEFNGAHTILTMHTSDIDALSEFCLHVARHRHLVISVMTGLTDAHLAIPGSYVSISPHGWIKIIGNMPQHGGMCPRGCCLFCRWCYVVGTGCHAVIAGLMNSLSAISTLHKDLTQPRHSIMHMIQQMWIVAKKVQCMMSHSQFSAACWTSNDMKYIRNTLTTASNKKTNTTQTSSTGWWCLLIDSWDFYAI